MTVGNNWQSSHDRSLVAVSPSLCSEEVEPTSINCFFPERLVLRERYEKVVESRKEFLIGMIFVYM